jgi:hypothetical protein
MIRICGQVTINASREAVWKAVLPPNTSIDEARQVFDDLNRQSEGMSDSTKMELLRFEPGSRIAFRMKQPPYLEATMDFRLQPSANGQGHTLLIAKTEVRTILGCLVTLLYRWFGTRLAQNFYRETLAEIKYRVETGIPDEHEIEDTSVLPLAAVEIIDCKSLKPRSARQKFEQAMAKVPDVEPEERDRL